VDQRHGVPSALSFAGSGELAPYQPPSGADRAKVQALPAFYWLYDLAGHKLTPDMAAPNNCLTTASHWLFKELSSINADIGPWGCGLIVVIHGDGDRNAVGGYRIEMVSGYTEALNHFANRLKEMNALKKKVGQMQTYKPKL